MILPKIAPHAIASIEHVDGPSHGLGAVRLTKLGTVAPPGAYVKEKLIAFDGENFSATNEELEGGHLVQGFTKWVNTVKFTPINDTTTKWESTVEYEGGNEASIAKAKEGGPKLMGALAAYINSTA